MLKCLSHVACCRSKTSLRSDTSVVDTKGSKEQLQKKGKNGLNNGRLTQDETAETGNVGIPLGFSVAS